MRDDTPAGEPAEHEPRRLCILGSTGSVGTQTLDVVADLNRRAHEAGKPEPFQIVGLAAGSNADLLAEQARRFKASAIAIRDPDSEMQTPPGVRAFRGEDAATELIECAASTDYAADLVVAAMVGAAGIRPTFAALSHGLDVALANKETLVAAGELALPLCAQSGAHLYPVDSEHAAIWQCLRSISAGHAASPMPLPAPPYASPPADVSRIVLTASGGPFREASAAETYSATAKDALRHPVWSMGAKNTIDSASLVNKGLELIETHWLFGVPHERIGVLVHPGSIVHSFVEFDDASIIAQLGDPDMRNPIQHALTYPARPLGPARRLDLDALTELRFEQPDHARFPALGLARRTLDLGGTAGAVFNAANETAVASFLREQIPMGRIAELIEHALDELPARTLTSLDDVFAADEAARAITAKAIARS
ncbi:MAG: 1-deoxy-D-xylulose-5-phosphate reductoisomerase [Planctomycetota bacterium]